MFSKQTHPLVDAAASGVQTICPESGGWFGAACSVRDVVQPLQYDR